MREAEAAATTAAARAPVPAADRGPAPGRGAGRRGSTPRSLVGGRLGPGEAVVMRMYGRLALHAESVVLPLLAPDVPVVTWWHGAPPDRIAHDPLGVVGRPADHRRAAGRRTRWRRCGSGPRTTRPATPTWPGPGPPRGGPCWPSAFDTARCRVDGGDRDRPAGRPGGAAAGRLAVGPARLRGAGRAGRRARARGRRDRRVQRAGRAGRRRRGRADPQGRGIGGAVAAPASRTATCRCPSATLGDLLAEELRRLDADQPYAEALGVAAGVPGWPTGRTSRGR